ncbi:MAG TPA: ubiquinol-cytochrome c reductase cytochrome b subunit, partial [Streptosporangiaceae bacterium]|nr:ubiquinol-cytochrome c reductase cytochrome b subunit [Streptosporangiaceae bacterium]
TALGIGVITFYGILWAEGANDIIADQLNIPLYWTTWAARVGIFVGPVIAYIITKRICLGLQHKDNHLIEHGVETGIVRQLPGGEFIEETRPVDEDALAVLLSRSNYPPLPAGETAETDVPARSMRGGLGRVRERLYNVVTESSALPEPNGHAIGGGNGHAVEGNGHSHTAISSGATSTQADTHEGDEH